MCGDETKPLVNVFASAIVDTHRTYVEAGRISKKICAPNTVSADDLTTTVCSFVEDHPEMASHSGAQVAIIAMVTKWPCSK
ncbi:Rap1a/Tai family immunity protein [Pseudorhizobium flavum]|uniref:Rap1a/Tai family immunity protein n=1 Tax=Pseudorhizobium flavum TaxID=1335061 RepID=UPI003CD0D099